MVLFTASPVTLFTVYSRSELLDINVNNSSQFLFFFFFGHNLRNKKGFTSNKCQTNFFF